MSNTILHWKREAWLLWGVLTAPLLSPHWLGNRLFKLWQLIIKSPISAEELEQGEDITMC